MRTARPSGCICSPGLAEGAGRSHLGVAGAPLPGSVPAAPGAATRRVKKVFKLSKTALTDFKPINLTNLSKYS